jgi:hypothetical protein
MPTRSSLLPGVGRITKASRPSLASATRTDTEIFGMVAAFCTAGFLIAALLVIEGFELGAEFLRVF